MDLYLRNTRVVEDAFHQISEATGISSISETVTTFIKTEEQNYSLYNYVNMLNSEIDTIDEQNRHITEAIQRHESMSSMSAKDRETLKGRLRG